MKKIVFWFLPMLMTGCSSLYVPHMANVPLFDEKGETQVSASLSTNSVQASAAYAFTEKYAVQVSGGLSYGNFTEYNDIFTKKSDHTVAKGATNIDLTTYGRYANRYVEASVGRYNLVPQRNVKLEVFSGVAFGNSQEDSFHNGYGLFFIQSNLGQTFRIIEWGTSLRLAYGVHAFSWQDTAHTTLHNDFSLCHLEPMAFCRIGGEHVKFEPKIGLSLPIGFSAYKDLEDRISDTDYYRTTLLHVSLGVHFSF